MLDFRWQEGCFELCVTLGGDSSDTELTRVLNGHKANATG